jgi:hypothetical protein
VYDAVADGAQVLRLDSTRAQAVLDVFRGEDPTRIAPDNTVIAVANGTPTAGVAAEAAAALRALGFVLPPDNVGDAESTDVARTTIRYQRDELERALLAAAALPVDPVLEEDRSLEGADVQLVLGADFAGVGTELRPVEPPADAATTTTAPVDADGTTTTSIYGEVPAPAPTGTSC